MLVSWVKPSTWMWIWRQARLARFGLGFGNAIHMDTDGGFRLLDLLGLRGALIGRIIVTVDKFLA